MYPIDWIQRTLSRDSLESGLNKVASLCLMWWREQVITPQSWELQYLVSVSDMRWLWQTASCFHTRQSTEVCKRRLFCLSSEISQQSSSTGLQFLFSDSCSNNTCAPRSWLFIIPFLIFFVEDMILPFSVKRKLNLHDDSPKTTLKIKTSFIPLTRHWKVLKRTWATLHSHYKNCIPVGHVEVGWLDRTPTTIITYKWFSVQITTSSSFVHQVMAIGTIWLSGG